MRVVTITFLIAVLNIVRFPTAVGGLLFLCAFVALPAGVAAVRVDAVESVQVAWLPHVSDERLDRVSPALADEATDAAVVGEVWIALCVAAGNHALPDYVSPRGRETVRFVRVGLSHCVTSMKGCDWLEPADVSASVPARFILAHIVGGVA
jgi:hypothetical protein